MKCGFTFESQAIGNNGWIIDTEPVVKKKLNLKNYCLVELELDGIY